mmetsp:Transcript_20833/g.43643  ORF Transcript_20833/g.43643 Transcript_20833/m.43643 type:complete len:159 (+) Transcript_20833:43-519(+)
MADAKDDLVEEELEFSWQLPSSSEVAGIQRDHAGRVVKPDKKQREAVHGMSSMELLELLLQQVFLRAYADGLVAESFSLQQQIHEELWNHPAGSRRMSPATYRNLQKLLSRMSWHRMIQFVKSNPKSDHAFLDNVQRQMASLRPGDVKGVGTGAPFWL